MFRGLVLCLFALAALAQIPEDEPPPPRPDSRKGVIEGSVVDGVTHKSLKGVSVMLQGGVLRTGGESIAGQPDYPITVTDAGGRFSFRGLPAGVYNVSASKPGVRQPSNVNVRIGPDEQKRDVEVPFTSNGSFHGRVVDEDGLPISGCPVVAVSSAGARPPGQTGGQGQTDEKGEYHVDDLTAGRYRVLARCDKELPAAHPLLPHGDPRTPHETYVPQLFGGGLDPASATVLTVSAGAAQEGIDFQLRRAPSFTVRFQIGGADAEALGGSFNLAMFPSGAAGLRNFLSYSETRDRPPAGLEIRSVTAGAYLVIAYSSHNGHTFYAQRTVEIGDAPPGPVEIWLAPGVDLRGSVQLDSNDSGPIEDGQIVLAPLDHFFPYEQHHADLNRDGTFFLSDVGPGRWRAVISGSVGDHNGAFEYIKSLSLGGAPAPAFGFEIAPGAAGPLHIVLGTTMAQANITVSGAVEGSEAFALLFPEDRERFDSGLHSSAVANGKQIELLVPPGHYRLLAIDRADLPLLLELFPGGALINAFAGKTVSMDLTEGGVAEATAEIIPHDEVKQAVEDRE